MVLADKNRTLPSGSAGTAEDDLGEFLRRSLLDAYTTADLTSWLGLPSEQALGGAFQPLPLFRS